MGNSNQRTLLCGFGGTKGPEGAVLKIELLYIMDFFCFVCDENKKM